MFMMISVFYKTGQFLNSFILSFVHNLTARATVKIFAEKKCFSVFVPGLCIVTLYSMPESTCCKIGVYYSLNKFLWFLHCDQSAFFSPSITCYDQHKDRFSVYRNI
jgi:hypothetical protein